MTHNAKCHFQRRFSEYREWETEESANGFDISQYGNNNAEIGGHSSGASIELIEHHHAREYSLSEVVIPQTQSNNLPNRTILPTLSISGPSPPQEEEFL